MKPFYTMCLFACLLITSILGFAERCFRAEKRAQELSDTCESKEFVIRELASTVREQQYLVEYYSNRWEITIKLMERR